MAILRGSEAPLSWRLEESTTGSIRNEAATVSLIFLSESLAPSFCGETSNCLTHVRFSSTPFKVCMARSQFNVPSIRRTFARGGIERKRQISSRSSVANGRSLDFSRMTPMRVFKSGSTSPTATQFSRCASRLADSCGIFAPRDGVSPMPSLRNADGCLSQVSTTCFP